MKSVGIITFQWFDNYGTVLQAYGLQTALSQLGYDSKIIPIVISERKGLLRFASRSWNGFCKKVREYFWQRGPLRHRAYQIFRNHFFCYAPLPKLDFKTACRQDFAFDVLVFGSDNIWSPWCTSLDDDMGNVFYGTGVRHPHKVVYAASTAGNLSDHPRCAEVLERVKAAGFKAVSLREQVNVEFFKKAGIEATRVPDPAFLLSVSGWKEIEKPVRGVEPGQYVLGYDLGHRGEVTVREECEELANGGSLRVLIPYPKKFWLDRDVACYPDPLEWLWLVHHAKVVVTNSFHGVMFSIVFNRPFKFIPIAGGDRSLNMRVVEVLDKVCLPYDGVSAQIDWSAVNRIVAKFRSAGLNYLSQNCG